MNTFHGCDEGLLEGARSLFLVTYALIGLSVCPLIVLCFVAASAIASAIEDDHASEHGLSHGMSHGQANATLQALSRLDSRARAAMV